MQHPAVGPPQLSLQAALSAVIADLATCPVRVDDGADAESCSTSSDSSTSGNDSEAGSPRGGTSEGVAKHRRRSKARVESATVQHQQQLYQRAASANPFAPLGADGSALSIAFPTAQQRPNATGADDCPLRVPCPLLLQVLPPRLCANAVTIAAHGGERVVRLVVLGRRRRVPMQQNHMEGTSHGSYGGDGDQSSSYRDGGEERDGGDGLAPPIVLRHMFQVGQHYNLYPMLYCSCSAFRYHCAAPNSAATANNGGLPVGGGYGVPMGMAGPPPGGASSSMVCKHLAAVAVLAAPNMAAQRHGNTANNGNAEGVDGISRRPANVGAVNAEGGEGHAAMNNTTMSNAFPRERLVDVRNPFANAGTQRGDGNAAGDGRAGGRSESGFAPLAGAGGGGGYLMPQLSTAANTNRQRGGGVGAGVVMGSSIEDKEITAEEFSRIWGSELFR